MLRPPIGLASGIGCNTCQTAFYRWGLARAEELPQKHRRSYAQGRRNSQLTSPPRHVGASATGHNCTRQEPGPPVRSRRATGRVHPRPAPAAPGD